MGLGRAPVDVGVGGGGLHLPRHDVKEEVGLMDASDRGEKRKVDDFSTMYSMDHGTPGPPPPTSHASTTPPRSLPDHNGNYQSKIIYISVLINPIE